MLSSNLLTLDHLATAIAADRCFDAAATSYVESYSTWRRGLAGFNKVISSSARRRVMKNVLGLHFGNATENPDDGATFERLLARSNASEANDNCGPRVLRTVIALAQHSGHLAVGQGWYDRRLKILRPTDRWIAEEAARHEVALASLAQLAQDRTRFLAVPHGAALVGRITVAAGREGCAPGVSLGEPDGELRALVALDGGQATAFAVADAWMRGKRLPSHKEVGESFRLSASQARKILRLAADKGLVTFDRAGKIADAAALATACRRLVAYEFAIYARAAAAFPTAPTEAISAPAFAAERPAEHAH